MCQSCWNGEQAQVVPDAVRARVAEHPDEGLAASVRQVIIARAWRAAHDQDRGCAGWLLIQRLYPDITWEEWTAEGGGDPPDCNGENLRGLDHTDECGPSCRGSEYGCCGYCPECCTHHADGEAGNADGDNYCSSCERCSDCEHYCPDH